MRIEDSINIVGTITPVDTRDTYPTHEARYGKGGYVSVENKNDVPIDRRDEGMLIYEISSGDAYVCKNEELVLFTQKEGGWKKDKEVLFLENTDPYYLSEENQYYIFVQPQVDGVNLVLPEIALSDVYDRIIVNRIPSNSINILKPDLSLYAVYQAPYTRIIWG